MAAKQKQVMKSDQNPASECAMLLLVLSVFKSEATADFKRRP